MRKRIFRNIFVTALASVLVVSGLVLAIVYRQQDTATWNTLRTESHYVAEGVGTGGVGYLVSVGGYDKRITLVAPDGTVLYDDAQDEAAAPSHADRPEIQQALQSGTGTAQRVSDTLGKRTLYYAQRLGDGSILRLSTTVDTLWAGTLRFIPWLLLAVACVGLAAMLLARRLAKGILRPLEEIDMKNPLEGEAYDELSPLLRRIEKQNVGLRENMERLRESRQEFDTITANMDEGLVMLGTDRAVLSINASARHILRAGEEDLSGRHILEINRDIELDKAVEAGFEGHKTETVLELEGRKYRLLASPASTDGSVHGVVLLLVDETEKLEAENLRREFSANVSHELKTPLTSISGYAEILQKGLVQPEDVAGFAGRIHEEAERLILLVGDIIKLSKLDEKDASFVPETVNLLDLARASAAALAAPAAEKEVLLSIKGSDIQLEGIRGILSEVLYNLIDNAIKYNRQGGEVRVTVWQEEETAYIKVADTGLGIPADQQARVFERFYRGDTSHSSAEIAGTGLGLSIVKRGVLYHGGGISLESMPGKGSTFLISLPL